MRTRFRYIFLCIVFTCVSALLSQKAFATLSCEQLFLNDYTAFHGYFKIDKKDQRSLNLKHQELVSQKLIQENDLLSQSGLTKPFTNTLEIQFPQDNGKYTNIAIYGRPYLENGTMYVDFQIWSRDWGSDNLINDRDSKLLRRFTLEQFITLAKKSFISELKYRRKMVQIETEPNTYEIYFLREILEASDTVIVESAAGESKSLHIDNVIKWNIGLSKTDLTLFSKFFSLGGVGKIYHVPSHRVLTKVDQERNYLLIEDLPSNFLNGLNDGLASVIKEGISIALTGEGNGIHAAVTKALGNKYFSNSLLIITPTTHKYIIDHEMRHIADRRINLAGKIIEELKVRFPNGNINIPEIVLARLFTLISEQRAYQAQFEAMVTDSTKVARMPIVTIFGSKEISFSDFMKRELVHHEFFIKSYVDPLQADLKILRVEFPDEWNFIAYLVKKYSLPSKVFNIDYLFD